MIGGREQRRVLLLGVGDPTAKSIDGIAVGVGAEAVGVNPTDSGVTVLEAMLGIRTPLG